MMRVLRRGYLVGAYYASWLWFGLGGLLLNGVSALSLLLPGAPRRQRRTRAVIRWLFELWTKWFHASGVLAITWRDFPADLPRGAVYVANHPSLVDAPILLSRLPDAVCIFKSALMRNPAIGPAAIAANYAGGDSGVEVLRNAADRVADGQSLLVFPEGTRTAPGLRLGPFKPGFALIAQRAGAPVLAIQIRASAGLVRRGSPWWRPPAMLPASIEFTLAGRWEPDADRSPLELAADVEQHLLGRLPEPA
jgi:1-acyl-sn-glycerol-3-phosphate acyltransferase